MLDALREPHFRKLWLAGVCANTARWMDVLVLGWIALELTDSPLLVGLAGFCRSIPMIALGPVGARLAAGHRLRLTVSSSDFPQWDRNLNSGGPLFREPLTAGVVATQTVLHDAVHPSCVTLPVYRPHA